MNTKLNHLLFPIEIHIRSVKTNINTCILKYNVPHTLQVSIVNKISFQLAYTQNTQLVYGIGIF